jgi:hypothetical protein
VNRWLPARLDPAVAYFHGTDCQFSPGDVLTPEGANAAGRKHPESSPGHLYFTAVLADARPHGARVYRVVPAGPFERDAGPADEGFRTAGGLVAAGEAAG